MRFLVLAVLLAVFSCTTPTPDPREGEEARNYNDSLLNLWHQLDASRAAWAEAIANSSPAQAGRAARQFIYETDTLLIELHRFPDFNGDSSLRSALILLTEVSRSIAGKSPNTLSILLTETTVEPQPTDTVISADTLTIDSADPYERLIARYLSATRKAEKQEQEAWLNFVNVQQAFAKRHGFVLPRNRNDSIWLED